MKKVIVAKISEHPELQSLWDKTELRLQSMREQEEFLNKRLEALIKDLTDLHKKYFEEMTRYCKEKKLLPPEYKEGDWQLTRDDDFDLIYTHPRDESGSKGALLKMLMDSIKID